MSKSNEIYFDNFRSAIEAVLCSSLVHGGASETDKAKIGFRICLVVSTMSIVQEALTAYCNAACIDADKRNDSLLLGRFLNDFIDGYRTEMSRLARMLDAPQDTIDQISREMYHVALAADNEVAAADDLSDEDISKIADALGVDADFIRGAIIVGDVDELDKPDQ